MVANTTPKQWNNGTQQQSLSSAVNFMCSPVDVYKRQDTMTGKIEIVQWSLDDDKEGSATLNDEDLSLGTGCGTFELYPTKNIYQFLLLDKVTGRRWHVQWGFESSKRWIKRIY